MGKTRYYDIIPEELNATVVESSSSVEDPTQFPLPMNSLPEFQEGEIVSVQGNTRDRGFNSTGGLGSIVKYVGVESSYHKYLVRLFVHDKGKAFIGYCDGASFCGIMMMGMMMGILVV